MDKEGIIDEMRQDAQEKGQQFVEPNLELAGVKQAYDHVTEQIKKQGKFEKDIACNDLFEDLLHEKSFSLSKFTNNEGAENDTAAERAQFSPEGIEAKQAAEQIDLAGLDEKELRQQIEELERLVSGKRN